MSIRHTNLRLPLLAATAVALLFSAGIACAAGRSPQPAPHGYSHDMSRHAPPSRPERFDHDRYHHDYNGHYRYGIGPFFGEPGWTYGELALGAVLPPFYRTPGRYLSDYWVFGLEVPPMGYEWVRYGPDALLINLDDGVILQAVRNVFP